VAVHDQVARRVDAVRAVPLAAEVVQNLLFALRGDLEDGAAAVVAPLLSSTIQIALQVTNQRRIRKYAVGAAQLRTEVMQYFLFSMLLEFKGSPGATLAAPDRLGRIAGEARSPSVQSRCVAGAWSWRSLRDWR